MPFFLSVGCQNESETIVDAQPEILEQLKQQQNAWNQGDLDGFMSVYDNSEDLAFVTSGGLVKGHIALKERYKASYPNTEMMGKLNFDIVEFRQLDNEHAVLVGQWVLIRDGDRPQGYFTLVWEKKATEWKIIYDHTS